MYEQHVIQAEDTFSAEHQGLNSFTASNSDAGLPPSSRLVVCSIHGKRVVKCAHTVTVLAHLQEFEV
jgi:hypothetical protein